MIDHLHHDESVTSALARLAPDGIAISVLSVAELYEGVHGSTDPERTERALPAFLDSGLTILGLDAETAQIFGRERNWLRQAGRLIGHMDLLIAPPRSGTSSSSLPTTVATSKQLRGYRCCRYDADRRW